MPEFFNVLPPDEALALLLSHLTGPLGEETVSTTAALGRITHREILAPHSLPLFRRSTMDGYAVRAADTFGATGNLPALLTVIGEVPMGQAAGVVIGRGEASIVHTGGMVPETADAVIQIEMTQMTGSARESVYPFEIEVLRPVAIGDNTLQIGEDVAIGTPVFPPGHRLRAQDIGGLLALGITEITVARRPRVAIMATGDEVIDPAGMPNPGQIRDINSYTVAAQTIASGGEAVLCGIVPDNLDAMLRAAAAALDAADMLVLSAGSSVSVRDMTAQVIDALGQPGVLLHGVATRPGKPTIAGVVGLKPVLGLPGNPVSAMVQFDMLGIPAIYQMQGSKRPIGGQVQARLESNIPSVSGREDYVPAVIIEDGGQLKATPVFGKSNLIYTLVNADGLIRVPLNSGGLLAGQEVTVRLF